MSLTRTLSTPQSTTENYGPSEHYINILHEKQSEPVGLLSAHWALLSLHTSKAVV